MSAGVFKVRHEPSQMFPHPGTTPDLLRQYLPLAPGELCPVCSWTFVALEDPAINSSSYLVLSVLEEISGHPGRKLFKPK